MTSTPTWRGPALDGDQRDLLALLDDLAADREPLVVDDPAAVQALVGELVELGLWTVGAAEEHGGGGADRLTAGVVLERLGRTWPALGLASAQATVATDLVGRDLTAVAVVELASSRAHLEREGDRLTGTVDRVDAASETPHLLVVLDDERAALVAPDDLAGTPLERTGLAGALTRSLTVDAVPEVLDGLDTRRALASLHVAVATVAAGLAAGAADEAVAYSQDRVQFGAPLTALATVRRSLLDQGSSAAAALAAALAAPLDPVAALGAARSACATAIDVAAAALQSHGGYGYLTEYAAERHLRDAVSLRAAADLEVGERLIGLTLAPRKEAS